MAAVRLQGPADGCNKLLLHSGACIDTNRFTTATASALIRIAVTVTAPTSACFRNYWSAVSIRLDTADSSLAGQEVPRILWKRRFFTVFRNTATFSILGQINPVQASHPSCLKSALILSSIVRERHPRSLFPSGFPPESCI